MELAEQNKHYLYPSTIFASNHGYQITTILGSCVAVCLYDPYKQIGGMNHFMLPFWNGEGLASPKYGNIAIEKLIKKMLNMGSGKGNLKAKIFGGAAIMEAANNQYTVGEKNYMIAQEILNNERITVIASSVGGTYGRKILFNTQTGGVRQKYIRREYISY